MARKLRNIFFKGGPEKVTPAVKAVLIKPDNFLSVAGRDFEICGNGLNILMDKIWMRVALKACLFPGAASGFAIIADFNVYLIHSGLDSV